MRTNIDIDDTLMDEAMRAGHFKTKKDAVEAGLQLLKRQAAYREILKWEGKLHWDGDEDERGAGAELVTGTGRARSVIARSTAAKPPAAKQPRHGRR
jgi:Arc/MetJ family transcription regulator